MLLSKFQEKPSFDFVPYKFGCFSFQANADLGTMTKYKQVEDIDNTWRKIDKTKYVDQLKIKDKEAFSNLKRFYGKKTSSELISLTYRKYPFYAINSTILTKVLNEEEVLKVEKIKNREYTNESLFTIGYEGITLEAYLNKLLKHGVNALIDVRKNSFSMKYGFSKKQLNNSCTGVNIQYYHFPELGIESVKRKELNDQKDYDRLFDNYKNNNLIKTISTQKEILKILIKYKRVALTCFEANICQCHRKPLAESISKLPDFNYAVKHI